MKSENYVPPFLNATQKLISHTGLSQNHTHCRGEDESCTLANGAKTTKTGQRAVAIFLAWTMLDVKSSQNLKGSASMQTLRQVVPS